MSRLQAFFFLCCAFLTAGVAQAQVARECETSCSQYCIDLVRQYEAVAFMHHDYCDGGQGDCVKNCVSRYADGTCRQYGPDYCGRQPVCVAKCESRYADGTCRTYGADACGEAPLNCVANCNSRYTDGTCRTYAADHCGRNAWCRPQCTARYPDGTCRTWGADQCGG